MTQMGYFVNILNVVGYACIIFLVVINVPSNLPDGVKFTKFNVLPAKDLGNGFGSNNLLNNVERLFENEIHGPEGFAVVNDELYTTLHGGYVAKVFDDQIVATVKFGEPCEGWWEEKKCGRPLGIKAFGNDSLIVADAYYGIFKYNVNNHRIQKLVDSNVIIDGRKPKIFNSVDVAKDGTVYWSHSSSDFDIDDGVYTFLADGSGRLLKYDPRTNNSTVLMKDLFFANGVLLSPDESFILIAESGHGRILQYFLKGPKKYTSQIFVDGLPGIPDNLRANGQNKFFVSLVQAHSHLADFQVLAPFPLLREFITRVQSLFAYLLSKLDEIYPHILLKKGQHYIGHLESVSGLWSANTSLLEFDWNGQFIRSFHGSDGSFPFLSDAIVHNGYLFMGSPINKYLGRIKMSNILKALKQ